ncbi:NACHT domain-containing protein [Nonomuraea thailandensis]
MRQILTYHHSVVLLGGPSRITNLLDRASSLALFGMQAVDLFDARAEAVRLGDAFIRTLRDKVKGLSRYDATQRMVAAHSVIVVTAYLEALSEMDVLRELTPEEQRRITGTGVSPILLAPLPMPSPTWPYEQVLADLRDLYRTFTDGLCELLRGLAVWDTWDETSRDRFPHEVTTRASRRYEELFRRLCAEFPEVACWSDRVDHQATRQEVRNLSRGMADLREQLARIPGGRGPSDRLAALIRSNQAALRRPILSSTRMPAGLTVPTLEEGYLTPTTACCPPASGRSRWRRAGRRSPSARPGQLPVRASHASPGHRLASPRSRPAGRGQVRADAHARRPPARHRVPPLRVELRGVPADADVLAQIEHGISAALDEQLSWPEFVHAAEGALPVVMLDGFDELLQATGVSQTDYLERVAQFQHEQAEKGRALAVIVTSRIAVADRARLPQLSYVIRLEPFEDDQIRQWVTVWNDANHEYFTERDLEPLPLDRVLAVPKLGEQPLLLLMLALYDADANALRHLREDLHEAELYERLLHDFAVREVGKSRPHLADGDLGQAVEDELRRLSITAFAMFNRGLQWIAEQDLDADLRALQPRQAPRPQGLRRPLSPAEGVIGGFFFIHTTQALRDEQRLKTYEFLHATFGEYLVARMVVRELVEMVEELAFAEARRRPARANDDLLQALLSFAALSVRAPTVDFLRHGIASEVPRDRRALLTRHLCGLFSQSLRAVPGAAHEAYQPVQAELTARCAAYSVNLMLLAVLSSDEPCRAPGCSTSSSPSTRTSAGAGSPGCGTPSSAGRSGTRSRARSGSATSWTAGAG